VLLDILDKIAQQMVGPHVDETDAELGPQLGDIVIWDLAEVYKFQTLLLVVLRLL